MRYSFLLIAALLVSVSVIGQTRVTLTPNIESQPVWGPSGYDHVRYYYLPDIETYYDVPQHKFYYYNNGRWIGRSQLPSRYRSYDFYRSYKVVVNEQEPYRNHKIYKDQYSSYKGRHDQQLIRDSQDARYFVIKSHPEHSKWLKQHKHDAGKGKGREHKQGKGNR